MTHGARARPLPSFGDEVATRSARGELVVQPRMGFPDPGQMRQGLLATRAASAATVGTITLDSYTRVGDHRAVRQALADGASLNGYPIVNRGTAVTVAMLRDVLAPGFPVQVRHGSADPRRIVAALLDCGLDATEGGPVSYCLPYSRMPLAISLDNWRQACQQLAAARGPGREPHLETFGGCMMGQLCPPAMLVALSLLEGMFFWQQGLRCISFSYAQQTHVGQDEEAIAALHTLIGRYVPDARTHVVLYTYMGMYPRTQGGALRLLGESAALAARAGVGRLIVKTAAEAHRLPTIAENVAALEHAAAVARETQAARETAAAAREATGTGIWEQAKALVENVLSLDDDIGRALVTAFARGHLDVPFCLHPDNPGRVRGYLDPGGQLLWERIGSLPIAGLVDLPSTERTTSASLLTALRYMERKFDGRVAAPDVTLAGSTR